MLVANKCVKCPSSSLVIRAMTIQPIVALLTFHSFTVVAWSNTHPLEWLKLKRWTVPDVGPDARELGLSCTAGGNRKWYTRFGKNRLMVSWKVKYLLYDSAISHSGVWPREKNTLCPYRDWNVNVYSYFICNSQNLERIHRSINR